LPFAYPMKQKKAGSVGSACGILSLPAAYPVDHPPEWLHIAGGFIPES
jgi:hypothetical protein